MVDLTGPFKDALHIIRTIERAGYQAYFVGGCVRDLILNRTIGDIDITTSATPDVIQGLFANVIPVGIEHGTVIVRYNKTSYEVTTFRVEGEYSDGRHPDSVSFIDQLDKDLERRDFTMNALAMDKSGDIVDLFGGKADLKKRVIRTVGDGKKRFKEDPLRILRALRFSSQLGFDLSIETIQAIVSVKAEIEGLAVERITKELEKLFAGDHVKMGLQYVSELQLEEHLPVFQTYSPVEKFLHHIKPLHSLAEVICLLHQMNPDIDIRYIVKAWKCSNHTWKTAERLNEALEYGKIHGIDRWLAYLLLPDLHEAYCRLMDIINPNTIDCTLLHKLKAELPISSRQEMLINGNDIIEMFPTRNRGPWIQKKLNELEKQIVLGSINNEKSTLKDWVKWNPPEVN
ncbi:CCA tRNA nucleotidyltransferase [Ornithinibacillus bavariensis]|uniref:CCA tRNA nucleotidyltransferase n=1 Tax=Ornithinibacillus bavariensis TaxID=545502 RepID=UPI001BB348C2|nr:CCA tRNA nucleotidyltransferase [Ornithinibacillus bavariensis]